MVAALLISGICSILEATLMSTPMSFISSLEAQDKKGAGLLKKYKLEIDRPISAILVLNTIANTVGASLVGSEAMQMAQTMNYPHDTVIGIVSGVFTLLILICSEIIPKTIGSTFWRKLALPASKVIRVLVFVTFPLVWCLERITHLISHNANQQVVSREEVSAMVTVGAEEGVLEKKENKMIQNLLKLDEITAHEIMTPSVVVSMADSSMTLKEFYADEELSTGREERIAMMEEAIDDLPPDEGMLIHLYYYEDRPLRDIAYIMDVEPNALATRLHRIRKKLLRMIKQKENE